MYDTSTTHYPQRRTQRRTAPYRTSSNNLGSVIPSRKCSQERLTQGTVTSTMRQAAHPPGCAGAGRSAMKYQSLLRGWTSMASSSSTPTPRFACISHPGGNPGANLMSISHTCYLREVAFEWELTKKNMHWPLNCLQGVLPREVSCFYRDKTGGARSSGIKHNEKKIY